MPLILQGKLLYTGQLYGGQYRLQSYSSKPGLALNVQIPMDIGWEPCFYLASLFYYSRRNVLFIFYEMSNISTEL